MWVHFMIYLNSWTTVTMVKVMTARMECLLCAKQDASHHFIHASQHSDRSGLKAPLTDNNPQRDLVTSSRPHSPSQQRWGFLPMLSTMPTKCKCLVHDSWDKSVDHVFQNGPTPKHLTVPQGVLWTRKVYQLRALLVQHGPQTLTAYPVPQGCTSYLFSAHAMIGSHSFFWSSTSVSGSSTL